MINIAGKTRDSSKNKNGVIGQKWLRFIGLITFELIMVMILLALPFLETTSAHPALPDDLESNQRVIDLAEFRHQIDTAQVNNGPEAAIPALQGSTTLSISIKSSPWAVRDHNNIPEPGSDGVPSVYVIQASVTNTGAEAANNVTIVLDYGTDPDWVLLSGEDPTRTVSTLGVGQTTHAYWFAQQLLIDGEQHQYTVTTEADNATQVSTAENNYDPQPTYTIVVSNTVGSGNQGLAETTVGIQNIGDVFTMTQVYTLGTNPLNVALNPVGNDDFRPDYYRLVKVEARTLNAGNGPLDTYEDQVYLTSLHPNTARVEATYTFEALLVRSATICAYAGVLTENQLKYDKNYCSISTKVTVEPGAVLTATKEAEDLNGPPLVEGDLIRYTLRVTNTGTFTAFNVTVTDDLPDQVTCQSVTGGPGVCSDPLIWNVGTLARDGEPGNSAVLFIDVKINEGTGGQNIINSFTVTSTNADTPVPDPEVCPDGSTPVGGDCGDDGTPETDSDTTLDLSKTAEHGGGTPDVLEVGDTVTYTLLVTNTGNYTAFDVVVMDDLPDHVTCQNVIPSPPVCADPLIWDVGDLPKNGDPGYTASLMIIVEIDPSGEGQSIINSATVTGTNVFTPPPTPEVCPDGSTPTGDVCPDEGIPGPDPSPGADGVFLPIVIKN